MTNAMTAKSLTEGAHHIGLAVRDVAEARDFFVTALGFAVAADRPDYPALLVSDAPTLPTLWQVADPAAAPPVDRRADTAPHPSATPLTDPQAPHTRRAP